MRGRPDIRGTVDNSPGNTPAYAGKTLLGRCHAFALRKHPRVCGEDRYAVLTPTHHPETPPRMRGRPHQAGQQVQQIRNTPAYAGKTPRERQQEL